MKRYVIWLPANRKGEFEFLTSTQSNWTSSINTARREAKEIIQSYQENFDPPLTEEEAIDEIGKPVIYELTIKVIT